MSQTGLARIAWALAAIETPVFWTMIGLLVTVVSVFGPVLTNDGPAHLDMAHFILRNGDKAWPTLNHLYEFNLTLSPNALSHLLMAALMHVFPPLVTEQIIQVLCLISVPLAARLVLRRLSPGSEWLALFFFPVALERMFFLGLYNFCLSLTGFLLCLWAFLRLRADTHLANCLILATCLVITLAFQASGWMEAALAIGTMTLVEAIQRHRRGESGRAVLHLLTINSLALAPGTLLFMLSMLFTTGDRHITYLIPLSMRLISIVSGESFAPIGRSTAAISLFLGLTLGVLAATGVYTLARSSRLSSPGVQQPLLAMGMVTVSLIGLALIIPDEAGGGWTHVWRAQVFPYIGLVFFCALLPQLRIIRAFATAAAGLGGLAMIGMTFWIQAWEVPGPVREFNEADAWIGPHCTVAPILTQFKLDPANSARLFYHPMFHVANRFELRSDRAVLFSYNARLPLYPVRFKPGADPQSLLFGWFPGQRDTRVYKIDIAGYEAASGIIVDYVLLWDFPDSDQSGPYDKIRSDVARAHYQLVHRSSGGRLELYRRPGPEGCPKPSVSSVELHDQAFSSSIPQAGRSIARP